MSNIEGYHDIIKEAWKDQWFGDPMGILCRKLKQVKQALIVFNKRNGNVHSNVDIARQDLSHIQEQVERNPTDTGIRNSETDAKKKLGESLIQEESLLHQKSRVKWLSLGDRNNGFFFNQVRANWSHSKILAIENAQGNIVFGHSQVADVAVDFFKNSIGTHSTTLNYDLSTLNIPQISHIQASHLEDRITNETIYATLKSMKRNKSPGPDGFTVEFFLSSWDVVGKEFCEAVAHFFTSSNMHQGINSTGITLVPKVTNPTSMREFRPISLCSVAYKCIAKIIASRLKLVLPDLINISQSAFIKGRYISDNILLAQELCRVYNRGTGTAKCALKIDLHKAFDSLSWDFLINVLGQMNFPQRFVSWIRACITTPMYSVKINGELKGYFKGEKGLRQGDPMSPYLFAIAMNVLSCILSKIPSNFKYHSKCKDLKLNHLFFADDVLLFSNGDKQSVQYLMNSLDSFSAISGLRPNADKSTVFFGNCDQAVTDWIDARYNIPHGELPVRFLGVPLISTKLTVNDCIPLIEKITARIYVWTNSFLSLGGRAQLINSVLLSIQFFWSNHFILPGKVHQQIQSILSRFLWQGNIMKKGGAKVKWDYVCLPRIEGGLGFKNPRDWNKAQILFHLCKVINCNNSLWPMWVNRTALKRKHFWTLEIPQDCSWIWRQILKLRQLALHCISYTIGNGLNTSLWFTPWWHSECLATSKNDPIIAQAGIQVGATVNDWIRTGTWILPTPNRSHHHVNATLLRLRSSTIMPAFNLNQTDMITWNGTKLSKLKTWHIWEGIRYKRAEVAWYNHVWHRLYISRFAHYEWLLCLDRLPTLQRLFNMNIVTSKQCYLCVNGEEDSTHLFLHCPYSLWVLNKLASELHLSTRAHSWNHLLTLWNASNSLHHRTVAMLAAQVFVYHVWRERNTRAHDGGCRNPAQLLAGINVDIKTRTMSSTWFTKHNRLGILRRWLTD